MRIGLPSLSGGRLALRTQLYDLEPNLTIGSLFGADAVLLDRMFHPATILAINGESYRLKDKRKGSFEPKNLS